MLEKNNRIRIGIDARWIFPQISGIGKYTRQLIMSLAEIDQINQYVLIFDDRDRMKAEIELMQLDKIENFSGEVVPFSPFSTKGLMKLPRLLDQLELDIFHSTNFMAPLRRSRCKVVVTIHDLIPYLYPQYVPKSKKKRLMPLYKILMKRIVKKADSVIAVSNHTRKDILRCFKVGGEKVSVVYNGIDRRYFKRVGPLSSLRQKFKIEGQMAITVGRSDPYKNLIGLVQAFGIIAENDSDGPSLVIIGADDPRYPEVREFVEENSLGDRVFFAGYLDDENLEAAYRDADMLVHPSLYEGFGFPPVEAMACGTPVVSSDRASLSEVLGNAAELVDPEQPEQIAAAIMKVADDDQLYNRLIESGKSRARCFTLEKMARETLQVYRKIYLQI
jgi:glycosyltransferase involved in cell wall biosynthesis